MKDTPETTAEKATEILRRLRKFWCAAAPREIKTTKIIENQKSAEKIHMARYSLSFNSIPA
jgi:hypothetical protein